MLSTRKTQPESVREILSELTGADFEITQPPTDYPFNDRNVDWFIRCRKLDDIRETEYLNAVWKERGGNLWFESLPIGDSIDWIEAAYGEEAAAKSLDVVYIDFGGEEFQARFRSEYPQVFQKIQQYEDVAKRVSESRSVHLELRKSGSKGIVVFSFAAKITDPDAKSLEKKLQANVEALKEAWQQTAQEQTT